MEKTGQKIPVQPVAPTTPPPASPVVNNTKGDLFNMNGTNVITPSVQPVAQPVVQPVAPTQTVNQVPVQPQPVMPSPMPTPPQVVSAQVTSQPNAIEELV